MAKGKVSVNITKKEFQYIDGATGEELTPEQIAQKYGKGVKITK